MSATVLANVERLGVFEHGTPEFQENRQTRLGGSEIAAVLGLSVYQTRFSLWHIKRQMVPPPPDNGLTEWGRRLEPAVLAKFQEGHGDGWYDMGQAGSFVRTDRPWQMATPDGLHESGIEIVESKTAQDDTEWGEPGSGDIPIAYRCQSLWNLNVFGARRCWLPVLVRGCDYREYLIDLDTDENAEADTAALIAAGQKFMDDLANNVRPTIDDAEPTRQVLRELAPNIEREDVDLDPDLEHEYLVSTMAAKLAASQRDLATNKVLDAMGHNRNACIDGVRFAYRVQNKKGDDWGLPYLRADQRRLKQFAEHKTIQGATA